MPSTGLSRRSFLAAAGSGAAVATAGCFSELRSQITYDAAEQVSLSVKTVPADRDPSAVQIGQRLQNNLDAVGVDASHELLDEVQLLRDVLLNNDFDIFVSEMPGHRDPDELRAMLHSLFAPELGLQNPFGFASSRSDELLVAQRLPPEQLQSGDDQTTDGEQSTGDGASDQDSDAPDTNVAIDGRSDIVEQLQFQLLDQQPFLTVVSRPHTAAVSQDVTFDGAVNFASALAYLTIEGDGNSLETLRVGLQRPNVTENRNVLAAEYRLHDRLTDLLYDPLVRRIEGDYVPWMAREFSISESDTATVQLRPNLSWHDGTPLTAEDVAFTYRFCQDTALGATDSPVPAPRFRQQTSLVQDATAVDQTTVEFDLEPTRAALAPSALTVPILPKAKWQSRSSRDHEYFTKALTASIDSPVGSGPLRFESANENRSVTFRRFEDHFLRTTSGLADPLQPFSGGPVYEQFEAEGAPNISVVLDDIAEGSVQVLDGTLPVEDVPDARSRADVRVVESPTPDYYMIGINARRHPLSNYTFRSALGRLIDRDAIVESVFDGVAAATETPLHQTQYVSEDLEWDGQSVTGPFPGENGNLDAEAARQLFRDAGFRYHDGTLRGR
ncbi:ABC transporter substrate-binding protein [Salinarchaeum laminariae]|uniref:ABC transporter substrate-binding protein n=1 Tax=Salinarchaeum laminariae TaxID=869888 RepID=UPI0020C01A47|nr:ABC transporter substrate-binding protein [Salinarchaeum laminariae]